MALEVTDSTPPEVLKEMQDALAGAYSNVRDPAVMKKAAERMDRRAEKNAQLYGVHDASVEIVREMRDSR